MIKATLIVADGKIVVLEAFNPPVLPLVGDIVPTPDGKYYVIVQRTYIINKQPVLKMVGANNEPDIELQYILEEAMAVAGTDTIS